MKILHENLAVNQPGSVKVIPEGEDDLWLAYNIIAKGDTIAAETTRKVCAAANGKKKDSVRVKTKLEIKITDVDYEKDSSVVRVRGRVLMANEVMASGAYHTLEIERNKEFELTKKCWDSYAIDNLHQSSEKSSGADLAVVLLQQGSAQIFLIGHKVTNLCAKIDASNAKLFEKVFKAFVKHVDFQIVRCVVLASRDSTMEEFRAYCFQEAQRLKMKSIQENKPRFVTVNTVNKNRLSEILHDDKVMSLIKNTKAVMEIKAYKEFSDLLLNDSDRACYGTKSVEAAQEMMAIETLLITDDVLRNKDITLRKKYMELVKYVKKAGGNAFLFSSMHVSGEQLAQLTGIAAILRFPLPNLDELAL